MTSLITVTEDLLYPSSDGNPMADSTEQYRWIVILKENLEFLLRHMADVFIAADLLWYPVKVKVGEAPAPRQAPDVMVIFGRPKGSRRSYKQWQEGNIGPQVVFEILSYSNKTPKGIAAMEQKFQFYERYGVEEYYIYDPEEFTLQGWQRQGDRFIPIRRMSDWVSPRLGIRFEWQPGRKWVLYYPDGQPFSSFVEQGEQAQQAQQQAELAQQQAEQERLRAEQERSRAELAQQQIEQERLRAEQERSRAELAQQQVEQAQQQAEQERSRAELAQQQAEQERLRAELAQQQAEQERLRAELAIREAVPRMLGLGLSVEQIAIALGLPIATVQAIVDSPS